MRTFRYSGYRTMTATETAKAWRSRFKAMRERFEVGQAQASAMMTTAWQDSAVGMGDIVARVAGKRIQAEALAKAEALKKQPVSEPINTSKADIKDSIFSNGGTGKLASGTSIDLNSGRMTLSDGRVIDIKTGTRVNYTA